MAPPTLPTLTWNQTRLVAIAGSSAADQIAAIKSLLLTYSLHWKTAFTDDASYIAIAPKSIDADVQDCRIVIGGPSSNPTDRSVNQTTGHVSNQMWIGLAPFVGLNAFDGIDGGGTWDNDPWAKTTNSVRVTDLIWSTLFATTANRVWFVECEEILLICMESNAKDRTHVTGAGAIIIPPDVNVSENVNSGTDPGRVWGIVGGSNATGSISTTFWGTTTSLFGTGISLPNIQYLPPLDLTSIGRNAQRIELSGSSSYTLAGVTDAGDRISRDVHCYETRTTQDIYVGRLRQMRMGADHKNRVVLLDAGGTVVGYTISANTNVIGDALYCENF